MVRPEPSWQDTRCAGADAYFRSHDALRGRDSALTSFSSARRMSTGRARRGCIAWICVHGARARTSDRSSSIELPEPKVGLNGGCLIAPDVLLIAGAANLIWRVDLPKNGGEAAARVWLQHDNMKNEPNEKQPEQPGVNGIRYAFRTHYLYYTSTSQQLMMRVRVDPKSLEPASLPVFIAGGRRVGRFHHRRGCRGRLRDHAPREYD